MMGSTQHSPHPTTNPYPHVQVTITGNYPDPAFMIQHCGDSMPRLATVDGHSDLINSTYPPSLVPTVNIVRSSPAPHPAYVSQHLAARGLASSACSTVVESVQAMTTTACARLQHLA